MPANGGRFIIRRHPVGIILVYIEAILAVLAVILFLILLSPEIFRGNSFSDLAWIGVAMIIIAFALFFMLLVSTYIYNQNRIIVTDHDIEQIIQRGLFVRKISRLELSDVEDVSVSQKGLLPTLFGYGTLTIETAGAQQENFVFPYCSNPNIYAQRLLHVRGKYVVALSGRLGRGS